MSHTEEIPSVKEELERKTVDLLLELVHRSETLRIDPSDAGHIAKALWTVTSGLVSSDVSGMCASAANAAKPRIMTMRFIGRGNIMVIMWLADTAGYVINTWNTTTLVKVSKVVRTEIGPREPELEKLFSLLVKSGYHKL